MKLNEFLNEKNSNVERAYDYIVSTYNEKQIANMIDEAVLEFVDYEQMKEEGMDNEHEWYMEFGNGEAEEQVFQNLVEEVEAKLKIKLSGNEQISLYEKLGNKWQILRH